jgi:hypothetical protein
MKYNSVIGYGIVVVSGVTGLVGCIVILTMIIHRRHRDISDRAFRRMNLIHISSSHNQN